MGRPKLNRSREELLELQRARQKRYYERNKDRLNSGTMTRYWTKKCPQCNRDIAYTNKSNLIRSVRINLPCRSCGQKLRPYEYLYNSIKQKSNVRGIKFLLTYKEFLEFTTKKTCQYCGDFVEWVEYNANNGSLRGYTYNLDRIDNTIGYQKSNCCVCCKMCNAVKSNVFTYSEMMKLGTIIREIKEERKWKK